MSAGDWQATCPKCKRGIVVTFNKSTTAYLRPHGPRANRCPGSGKAVLGDFVVPRRRTSGSTLPGNGRQPHHAQAG